MVVSQTNEQASRKAVGAFRTHYPFPVPDRLEDLRGPADGHVMPPPSLSLADDPAVDLDDERQRARFYKRVLTEAVTIQDVTQSLNGALLLKLWPLLRLSGACRAAWQDRHPELAG